MRFPFASRRAPRTGKPRTRRCRPALEILEVRVVPANQPVSQIGGTVFQDLNANGALEAGEPGLANRVVYVDANNNGRLDPLETSTTTDAGGAYTLDLPPGEYTIRLVPGPAETLTAPSGGSYDVTVTAGFGSLGRNFGVLFTHPAEPLPQPGTRFPNVSTGNEAYVQELYRDILGRNAEPGALTSWENALPTGLAATDPAEQAARLNVATLIWDSAEHRTVQVASYYETLLGRSPDGAGEAGWVNAMLAGAREADVLHGFLNSAEYQALHPGNAAFVSALYHDLLGRAPDDAGLLGWVEGLNRGLPRTAVIDSFLYSTESLTRLVDSYYADYLNRPADLDGQVSWVAAVQQRALGLGQAGIDILASDEKFLAGLGGGGGVSLGTGLQDAPLIPVNTVNSANDVMWYDSSAQMKTLTITNNDPHLTVYPFLEGEVSRTDTNPTYAATPEFDAYDPLNQEYRGYIGYKTNDGQFLGLLPGQTITVNVPLAFWDSGRLNIATDGADLLGTGPDGANPYFFNFNNTLEINVGSTTPGSNILSFTPIYTTVGSTPGTPPSTPPAPVTPSTLEPGMTVTGTNVPAGTTIVAVTGNGLQPGQIQLSTTNLPADTNQQFKFQWTQLGVKAATWANNTVTITTTANNTFIPGEKIVIAGMTPTAYNGTFTITQADATSFQYELDADPGTATGFGTASLLAPATAHYTVSSVAPSGAKDPSIANGLIMWYHALAAQQPGNDAPFQLTEYTIRGDYYDPSVNPSYPSYLIGAVGSGDLNAADFNQFGYDVSYVDSFALPVAMEARDVGANDAAHTPLGPYGWVGASQTIEQVQKTIQDFAGLGPAGGQQVDLGQYFGLNASQQPQGYPRFSGPNPLPTFTGIEKLPSGQNLFLESPFQETKSSYPIPNGINNTFDLTSGGPGPVQVPNGMGALPVANKGTAVLHFDPVAQKAQLATLLAMWQSGTVVVTDPGLPPSTLGPGTTTVMKVETDTNGVPTGLVDLSQPTAGDETGRVYNFDRKVTDYAATAIMNLWYSWAQYYVSYLNGLNLPSLGTIPGSLNQNILTFTNPTQVLKGQLVPGMAVAATTNPASVPPKCIILATILDSTNTYITGLILSEVGSGSDSYSFTAPTTLAIPGYNDPAVGTLKPPTFPTTDQTAVQFSQVVYDLLSVMSTIPNKNAIAPTSVQVLASVIGGTIGFLPARNPDPNVPNSVQTTVTDMDKSLLRGVPDFTGGLNPVYADPSQWYPDPALPNGEPTLNAYNLDPMVWFVHEKLGLSGYGFALDDDTSFVNGNYATKVDVAIGGLGGLQNKNEWTMSAPFGPVHSANGMTTAGNNTTITNLDPALFYKLIAAGPANLGAQVNSTVTGLKPGVTIVTTALENNTHTTTLTITPGSTLPTSTNDFWFFGPITGTATLTPGSMSITDLDPVALATLSLVGPDPQPAAGLLVSGPGVQPDTTVVSILGTTVNLSKALKTTGVRAGTFAFTFR